MVRFIYTIFSVFFISLLTADAAGLDTAPGINLDLQGIIAIIRSFACWLVDIAIILIVIAVVIYGIQFLISRGDPQKLGKAKDSLKWGVVGIAVILGAYTIIVFVAYLIGADTSGLAIPLGC